MENKPQHIITEDYRLYKKRKNLKYWIIGSVILFLFLLLSIFVDYSDFNITFNDTSKEQNRIIDSFHTIRYVECLNSCQGIYSEGEEMIEACEILRDEEKPGFADRGVSRCGYFGITYICNCMKNESEEVCLEKVINYLNEINCGELDENN